MTTVLLACNNCGKQFKRKKKEYDRSTRLGKPSYCSRSCSASKGNTNRTRSFEKESSIAKAIILRENNYSYAKIASELGISRNTARNWVKHVPIDKTAILPISVLPKKPINALLATSSIRKRLLDTVDKCATCSISVWQNKKLTLELHHIDGDNQNNEPDNLKLLCPNCHSQTDNYRNKKRT